MLIPSSSQEIIQQKLILKVIPSPYQIFKTSHNSTDTQLVYITPEVPRLQCMGFIFAIFAKFNKYCNKIHTRPRNKRKINKPKKCNVTRKEVIPTLEVQMLNTRITGNNQIQNIINYN
ncbi:hypothetical protein NE237_001135 [Protea cynaroides]|uniref:Uncharacterized protein n=1 Tax=Protea cynaroides TaxID=273540 RepID=A0A9Q0KTJ5_9MAGN|nr:hypothetical protein NE237_001135 [Protea cynaroides]